MKKVVFCLAMLMSVAFAVEIAHATETKVGPAGAMKGGMEHKAAPAGAMKKGAAAPSCGQMIAGLAAIPEKLSEGATSVAEMLDAHAALLGKDKESQAEAKGLRAIAKTHKRIAASLVKASEEMKKAEKWPAAPHDAAKMASDPKLQAATKKVIEVHKELIAMLQKMVADMEAQQKAAK